MTTESTPKPMRLVLEQFPKEPWAAGLVQAFNQLALQTTQALTGRLVRYQTLSFTTAPAVEDSFPIDVQADVMPNDVHISQVVTGTPTSAVSLIWTPLNGNLARIIYIYGLASNTPYTFTLAMS